MFNDKDLRDLKWNKIFDHYQNDPRFAFYIYAVLKNNEKRVLEIGAGSFRDMAKLNQWGVECYGIDFSKTSIEKAKRRFTEYTKYIIKADSFELPFEKQPQKPL